MMGQRHIGLALVCATLMAAGLFLVMLTAEGTAQSPGAALALHKGSIAVVAKRVDIVLAPLSQPTPAQQNPAPPRLVFPGNGQKLDTIAPSFTIDNSALGQSARARVEYSRNPSFAPVDSWFSFAPFQGSATAPLDMNLLEGTTYYWHSRSSLDGVTWGPWSSVWSFFTPSGGTVGGTPTLISPASGSTASSLRPRFRWNTVPGATKYALAIAQYVFILPGTDFTINHDLDPGMTYPWTVTARNAYGWGSPSAAWTITTPAVTTGLADAAASASAMVEISRGVAMVMVVD